MNKSRPPVRRYSLRGGVDVNMYHTLLEPDFALGVESENLTDEAGKAVWDRFSIEAYRQKVLELAIPLLMQQLAKLPAELHAALVPGSAFIFSPHDYSLCEDELRFTIDARTDLSDREMQALLDDTVRDDWNTEFGSHYRISERLGENHSIYAFLKPEGGEAS